MLLFNAHLFGDALQVQSQDQEPVGLDSPCALRPENDGCKALRAANGYSIRKLCNAADAFCEQPLRGLPA